MKLFIFLISIFCFFQGFGQLHIKEDDFELPVFKAVSHPFMPTISSEYFYFSKDGLMWFSTAQGLCSFDGSEVVYYSTQEEAYTLGLNRIRAIAEDKDLNLYIAGDTKLSYFNRTSKTFTPISYQSKNSNESFEISSRCIYINNEGEVFIGTDARGLLIYNNASKSFQQFNITAERSDCWDDQNMNTVASFALHAKDTSKLWIGTFNGIYLFDKISKQFTRNFRIINPGRNKYLKCPALYDIIKMDVANDSTIWFSSSSSGFGKYNTLSGAAKLFIHDARLKSKEIWKAYNMREFARWTSGKYILGITDPNPGIFDTKTEKLQLFKMVQHPNEYDDIQYVANDRKDNIWMLNHGLLYVSMPEYFRLQTVSISKQLTADYLANRLGDIYFDKATSHYYAASPFSSGVYVLDTSLKVVKIIPVPLYTNRYTYRETSNEWITRDGGGRLWTSCLETYILQHGKSRFEYAEKVYPSLKWIKERGETWDIATTSPGNILLRFGDGTVFHIDHRTLIADSVNIPDYKWESEFVIGTTEINYDDFRNKLYLNNLKYVVQYDLNTHELIPLSHELLFGSADKGRNEINYALDNQGRLFRSAERGGQVIEYTLDDLGRIWVWIPRYGIRIIDPDKLSCVDSIPNGTRGLITGNFNYMRFGGNDCMLFIGLRGVAVYNYKTQQSLLFDGSNGWSGQFDYYKGSCNNHLFIGGRNQIEYFNLANFSKFNFELHPLLNTITAGSNVIFTRSASDEKIQIELPYYKNSLTFSFSAPEFFFPERIEYAYQLSNVENTWQYSNYFNRKITYTQLAPGKYVFQLKAQILGGNWQATPIEYIIIVNPAFWQTWWFKLLIVVLLASTMIIFLRRRSGLIHRKAVEKTKHEKELLELEAKALQAQMNPHFIFNCMNSIKSLIQKDEKDKATMYLTTFSKLIRTIFQNSDKREITLYDEIETCRLYTQLESMRFGSKLSYAFHVDETIDLKSIMVPALIFQPFIENAIWHGIMPKEEGGAIHITISKKEDKIFCVVEDDGIGREVSMRNKFNGSLADYQSKGVRLTQARLELSNFLSHRNATVQIIDKTNQENESTGTKVVVVFAEE